MRRLLSSDPRRIALISRATTNPTSVWHYGRKTQKCKFPLKFPIMESSTHKQQPEKRENVPDTDPDIHSTLALHSSQEVTSFVDETPVQSSDVSSQISVKVDPNPLPDQSLLDILSRPRIVSAFEWSPSSAVGSHLIRLAFPDSLFASSVIWSKIQQYAYLHADLKFSFRVNGTSYHYGTLLASWRPASLDRTIHPTSTVPSALDNIYSLSHYSHVLITPSSSQNTELNVSYQVPYNKIAISAFSGEASQQRRMYNMGVLDIFVLNALRASSKSNETPRVTVNVYASFVNPKLSGYTHQSFAYTPVTYPIVVNPPAPNGMDFEPMVTQGLSGDDSEIKPDSNPQNPVVYVPAKIGSSHYKQPTLFLSLSKRPLKKKPFEVKLREHLSHWSLLRQFSIATNTAANSLLTSLNVAPQNCAINGNFPPYGYIFFNTKLSYISKLFALWRGPIEYRFDFVSSKFHSCRVKLAWYPPHSTRIASFDELGDTWTKIIDIQGDISTTFTVPFIQPGTFLSWDKYTDDRPSNGTLVVTLLNSLSYPTPNGPPISCNVWIRAPALELDGFLGARVPPSGTWSSEDKLPAAPDYPIPQSIETKSQPPSKLQSIKEEEEFDEEKEFKKQIEATAKRLEVQGGPIDIRPLGKENINFLARKPTPFVYLRPNSKYWCTPPVLIDTYLQNQAASTGRPKTMISLLDYLSIIHIGYRGSLRLVAMNPVSDVMMIPRLGSTIASSISLNRKDTLYSLFYKNRFTSNAYFPPNVNALKDATLPMYSTVSYRPIFLDKLSGIDATLTVPGVDVFNVGEEDSTVMISAASDFAFVGIGAAPITFSSPIIPPPA
nr:capsid protein [buhirugu virus 10]